MKIILKKQRSFFFAIIFSSASPTKSLSQHTRTVRGPEVNTGPEEKKGHHELGTFCVPVLTHFVSIIGVGLVPVLLRDSKKRCNSIERERE